MLLHITNMSNIISRNTEGGEHIDINTTYRLEYDNESETSDRSEFGEVSGGEYEAVYLSENISDNSSHIYEIQNGTSSESDENTSESDSPTTSTAVIPSTTELQQSTESIIEQSSVSTTHLQSVPESVTTQQPTVYQDDVISEDVNNDEAFSCPICLESLTNTGAHRPACLKCGHIFGKNCLEKWMKSRDNNEVRRCPSCNSSAKLNDIRVLYTKQLIAVDTEKLTALENALQRERLEKSAIQENVETILDKYEYLHTAIDNLQNMFQKESSDFLSTGGPTAARQCLKKIDLSLTPGCRVMTFNENNMMLAVTAISADRQSFDSQLSANSHIIRKLDASTLEPSTECIYAHSKQIRDLAFHPNEHNLLASVSLDKNIKLIDMVSNTAVTHLGVNEALWSCCWAGDNPNVLVAGGQMGSLFYVDRRFMKLLYAQREQTLACVSLVPLPPSSSRSFVNGGFLKTRMDVISAYEQGGGGGGVGVGPLNYKNTELSLKGLWSSCSYDSRSNLLLSSSKPSYGANKTVRHIVSKISDSNVEGPLINPVVTFVGGNRVTQLSRSCIVPSNEVDDDSIVCSYDESSNNVNVFSVKEGYNVHNFEVGEKILDLCPLSGVIIDGRRIVAGLSEKSINIFSV